MSAHWPLSSLRKRKGRARACPTPLLPAVAAAATTATVVPPAATAAKFSGLGLVDLEVASLEILAIELRNRLGGVAGALHFDEAEASRLAREFVRYDGRACYFPYLREECFEIIVRHRIGEIAYVQFAGHLLPSVSICREALEQKTRAHSRV